MARRFTETVSCFEQAGKQWNSSSYIVQPVLIVDAILEISQQLQLTGVGIPDLIQLTAEEGKDFLILQIGDIKSRVKCWK